MFTCGFVRSNTVASPLTLLIPPPKTCCTGLQHLCCRRALAVALSRGLSGRMKADISKTQPQCLPKGKGKKMKEDWPEGEKRMPVENHQSSRNPKVSGRMRENPIHSIFTAQSAIYGWLSTFTRKIPTLTWNTVPDNQLRSTTSLPTLMMSKSFRIPSDVLRMGSSNKLLCL